MVPIQVSVHNTCFNAFYNYVDWLKGEGRFDDVVYVCRKLLDIDHFDEKLQL